MCREILAIDHPMALESIISLSLLYHQLDQVPKAIPLFYKSATHIVTIHVALVLLDLTIDMVTATKSDIMTKRGKLLIIIVERYQFHYGK
ncbi:hypothetical protein N7457_001977 [Penicillium paradoxum]|uniref:uncharacterized protein n=1 Tax=Penicillium paradoxum TaxID=176176 RepID=UPI0025479B40|nr:uncharacterized protein N7457_001977 [Penicillium paradoxum]KAJ5786987.1 hypothetical protein N7457_001977 [Penicillium paradoxum]